MPDASGPRNARALAAGPVEGVRDRPWRGKDFELLLATAVVVLLFLVPSTLAIRGLRSVGMPAQLLGWLALLHWVGLLRSSTWRRTVGSRPQPVRVLLAFLLAGSLVSYGVAFARPLVPLESGNADRLAFLLLAGGGIALLLADGLRDRGSVRRVVGVLVVSAYFSGVVGLLQYAFSLNYNQLLSQTMVLTINTTDYGVGQFQTTIGRGFRAYGTADHAIEFAVVCSTVLPLAVHLARHGASARARQWHGVGAALLAVGALISVSRSGVVGLCLGLAVYALTLPRRDLLNLAAAAFAVLVVVQVAANGVLSTLRYLLFAGDADPSLVHRAENIPYLQPLLEGNLWTGIGFGTYQPVVYRVLDNQYLVTLVSSGILGVVALLMLYVVGASLARAGRRHHLEERDRDLGQALAAGIVVLAVTALFYDQFAFRQSALLLFVLLGLSGAYYRSGRDAETLTAGPV